MQKAAGGADAARGGAGCVANFHPTPADAMAAMRLETREMKVRA